MMGDDKDLSSLPNPYDFSHPVSDPAIFSGREEQLEEIRYYLDQALVAARPMNMALLGPRAAGKTSLLNLIEWEARDRGMLVARVALNEDDAKHDLLFFWKLFDAVFSSACKFERHSNDGEVLECFGGQRGRTYQAYEDMITLGDIPTDSAWTPFMFPIQYAKAIASNRQGVPVSEPRFIADLLLISQEVGKPIVILFDECNVLGNNRVLLQQIRNIFMNTPGFMLVLTGTPDLFPVMDDVFSPIARDFKRIDVDAFKNEGEAEDCVIKPLKQLGLPDPRLLIDNETYRDLISSQGLTGQRPYEIQPLCHFLFRQLQRQRSKRMKLNLEVLDDVLRELGGNRSFAARPIIESARRLEKQQLRALGWLCKSNGRATFEQLWFTEYVIHGLQRREENLLRHQLEQLEREGIVHRQLDKIVFSGDEFDRIYLKYYARTRGVRLAISALPVESMFSLELEGGTPNSLKISPFSTVSFMISDSNDPTEDGLVQDIAEQFRSGQLRDDLPLSLRSFLTTFYANMFHASHTGLKSVEAISLSLNAPWLKQRYTFLASSREQVSIIVASLMEMSSRAIELGAESDVGRRQIETIQTDRLLDTVESCQDETLHTELDIWHWVSINDAYFEEGNVAAAVCHAEARLRLVKSASTALNNLGYLYLADGQYLKARDYLSRAIASHGEVPQAGLPIYNLGCLELIEGHRSESIGLFELAMSYAESLEVENTRMECLLIPAQEDGRLKLIEVKDPDLLETVHSARDFVFSHSN